jgi:hypothetical protein
MEKLNDLELEKSIAEIEGIEVSESVMMLRGNPIPTGRGLITDEYIEYDPLTNWLLLGPLMLKYEVQISYDSGFAVIHRKNVKAWGVTAIKSDKAGIPRAILECIIKANE